MILKKTPNEIKNEEQQNQDDYELRRAYAHMVKGSPESKKEVCEYYVISKTKGKIDVWDLNILDIVGYIIGHQKENGFEIVKYCKPEQVTIKDWQTLQTILELEEKYGHIVRDIVGSFDGNKMLEVARQIAFYETQIKGEKTTVAKVIDDMAKYEQTKQQKAEV